LDNQFCTSLERFRELSSSAFRPFSQFHGWWHIFAGYSTYLHILVIIFIFLLDVINYLHECIRFGGAAVAQRCDEKIKENRKILGPRPSQPGGEMHSKELNLKRECILF
jgi:hypothetical protein